VIGTDTARQQAVTRRRILPRVALHVAAGLLRLRYRTWAAYRALWWTLVEQCRSTAWNPPVSLAAYPAHAHTAVAAEVRGRGVGHALSRATHDHLRARGIPGLHGYILDRAGGDSAYVRFIRDRRGYRVAAVRRHPLLSRLTGEAWELKLVVHDLSPPGPP
jgi:GNAT superfamily N-acetyltransferase